MDLPAVGEPATRLRPGDRVSRASTDQTERAYGVVTGRSGISYVTVHYDADRWPQRTERGALRLEKLGRMWDEPPLLLLQRPRETDNRFKSRLIYELRRRQADAVLFARAAAQVRARAPLARLGPSDLLRRQARLAPRLGTSQLARPPTSEGAGSSQACFDCGDIACKGKCEAAPAETTRGRLARQPSRGRGGTGNPPVCLNCDNSSCDGKCEAPRR